jgi:hypothetical protein
MSLTDQGLVIVPSSFNRILFVIGYEPPDYTEGCVYYDTTSGTLALQTSVENVTLQIGQELQIQARNDQGRAILKGQIVYISGSLGNVANVKFAKADVAATATAIALATKQCAAGDLGFYTAFGIIRNINTSAFAAGDSIYLSPTIEGAMTNVRPTAPDIPVLIGTVIRASVNQGQALINIVRTI